MTAGLTGRPLNGGLPVPFACENEDGTLDHSVVVKRRAIQCALSRICGVCGETLTRPVAFLGPEREAEAGLFAFPPAHESCAQAVLDLFVPIGGRHLGQTEPPPRWALVTTGGFDLIRPSRRGGAVQFQPHSVIATVFID